MNQINDFLQETVPDVIAELPEEFTTRQFIWQFADTHEHTYIEMLFCAQKDDQTRVFNNLHSQMGRYLLEHTKDLHIEKRGEVKEKDINPFGRKTLTQPWRKIR